MEVEHVGVTRIMQKRVTNILHGMGGMGISAKGCDF